MSNATPTPGNGLNRGTTLRVDITGVLACLFLVFLVVCAAVSYGGHRRIDDVAQPIGPKAAFQSATSDSL
jgi:hypothetical protein